MFHYLRRPTLNDTHVIHPPTSSSFATSSSRLATPVAYIDDLTAFSFFPSFLFPQHHITCISTSIIRSQPGSIGARPGPAQPILKRFPLLIRFPFAQVCDTRRGRSPFLISISIVIAYVASRSVPFRPDRVACVTPECSEWPGLCIFRTIDLFHFIRFYSILSYPILSSFIRNINEAGVARWSAQERTRLTSPPFIFPFPFLSFPFFNWIFRSFWPRPLPLLCLLLAAHIDRPTRTTQSPAYMSSV